MNKKLTKSINAEVYLKAAQKLNYQSKVLSYKFNYAYIQHNNKRLYLYKNNLDINNIVACMFATNKDLSNNLLQKKFPQLFPDSIKISKKNEQKFNLAINFAKKNDFKVVIKPNRLSLGEGVVILPKNEQTVTQAVKDIFSSDKNRHLTIQGYITGKKEYRILILKQKIIDILQRIPAYVIGNGQDSIIKLIKAKNRLRAKHRFSLIKINKQLEKNLEEINLNLESVPATNKRVQLRKTCNFSQGGEVKRISPKSLNTKLKKDFLAIAKASRLNMIGIDYITNDLSAKPNKPIESGINEINNSPMQDIHYFADLKENKPFKSTKKILQLILE